MVILADASAFVFHEGENMQDRMASLGLTRGAYEIVVSDAGSPSMLEIEREKFQNHVKTIFASIQGCIHKRSHCHATCRHHSENAIVMIPPAGKSCLLPRANGH